MTERVYPPLNWVEVFMRDGSSYRTSVSAQSTKESCEAYFVGARLEIGPYDESGKEVFSVVERIEFHDMQGGGEGC